MGAPAELGGHLGRYSLVNRNWPFYKLGGAEKAAGRCNRLRDSCFRLHEVAVALADISRMVGPIPRLAGHLGGRTEEYLERCNRTDHRSHSDDARD